MCCWILQGRLLRKNDFEPVYSQTLFHICTQNPHIAKNEAPSPPHICGEDVQCKKAAKMQCCKMQGCALQTTPSRRNTNKYLQKPRTDFSRNRVKISGEIKNRFLEKSRKDFCRNLKKKFLLRGVNSMCPPPPLLFPQNVSLE